MSDLEVTSYTELMNGIQTRICDLGIRQVDFDKLACWADGLSGKVFGPAQVKRLGIEKVFDALRAAALRLKLEPDLERLSKQIAENCQPRQANQARMGHDGRRRAKGRGKPKPAAKRRPKRPSKPRRGRPYLSKSAA